MSKALFRYLLVIAVLLISGQDFLYASSDANFTAYQKGNFSNVTQATSALPEDGVYILTYDSSDAQRKTKSNFSDVAEVKAEEDEVHFSKKYLQSSSYYTISFDAKSIVYYFHYLKHRTVLCRQLSYHSYSEPLNVLLGVFQI